jgi:hypothetical protein
LILQCSQTRTQARRRIVGGDDYRYHDALLCTCGPPRSWMVLLPSQDRAGNGSFDNICYPNYTTR